MATWYVINTGDRGFSQVETALSQLHGEPCDDPALTGCYDFSFTLGDADHDLVLTSGNDKSYVNLDGQWYQTDLNLDIEQNLVKLLLRKGEPIPKEQWIHNPDYVSLGILLRNNKGLASTQQTICYADAPYEYAADLYYKKMQMSYTLTLARTNSDDKKVFKGKFSKEYPYDCSPIRCTLGELPKD